MELTFKPDNPYAPEGRDIAWLSLATLSKAIALWMLFKATFFPAIWKIVFGQSDPHTDTSVRSVISAKNSAASASSSTPTTGRCTCRT